MNGQIRNLNLGSLEEISQYPSPPAALLKLLECVMLVTEDKVEDESWAQIKKSISHPKQFQDKLIDLDINSLDKKKMHKLRTKLTQETLSTARQRTISEAGGTLCQYLHTLSALYIGTNSIGLQSPAKSSPSKSPVKHVELSMKPKESDDSPPMILKTESESAPEPKPIMLQRANSQHYELKTLTKQNISELKFMNSPPHLVVKILSGVLLVQSRRNFVPGEDAWEQARSLMSDPADFIKELIRIDLGRLNKKNMVQLAALLDNEDMAPENAKLISSASETLLRFVTDLYNQWREANPDIDLTNVPSTSTDASPKMLQKKESASELKSIQLQRTNSQHNELKTLTKKSISELRSFQKPAQLVVKIISCVLLVHS